MPTAIQSRAQVSPPQVAAREWSQQRLAEAFARLRSVYARRQEAALPGVSHQYISQALSGAVPVSLVRFVQFLGPLTLPEREFVLGAWLDGARADGRSPLVEIAEATEETGRALAMASRVLAAHTTSPRELGALRAEIHEAEKDLEEVEVALTGGAL